MNYAVETNILLRIDAILSLTELIGVLSSTDSMWLYCNKKKHSVENQGTYHRGRRNSSASKIIRRFSKKVLFLFIDGKRFGRESQFIEVANH